MRVKRADGVMLLQERSLASIQPEDTVYSGPQSAPPRRVTLRTIRQMYAKNEPLSMVTAYDYPSAVHVSGSSRHKLSGVRPCLIWQFQSPAWGLPRLSLCLVQQAVSAALCLRVLSTTSQPWSRVPLLIY